MFKFKPTLMQSSKQNWVSSKQWVIEMNHLPSILIAAPSNSYEQKFHEPTVYQPQFEYFKGKNMQDDGRMFLSELYCEGRDKPRLRGWLHVFAVVFLLPLFSYTLYENIETDKELKSVVLYLLGNLTCFGSSSMFHCFSWRPKTEILLQKLDHSFIFTKIACIFTCFSILLYPSNNPFQQNIIISTTIATWLMALYGVTHVFTSRAERIKFKILTICCGLPAYSIFSHYMTYTEQMYSILVLMFYGIGGYIFSKEIFNPIPSVFGYHEVFHLCSIIATIFSFFVMYSLIGVK